MSDTNDTTTQTTTQPTASIEGLEGSEFKILPLDDLIPDPNNPRVHTPENVNEIAESIKTLGFTNPIQVVVHPDHADKYKIVAGHGRYLALKQLNVKVAPSVILHHLDGDANRAMAANIADNEIALHSYYDEEKLAMTLNQLQEASEALVTASGINMDSFLEIAYGNAEVVEDVFELNNTTVADFKSNIVTDGDNKFKQWQSTYLTEGATFTIGDAEHRLLYGDASDSTQMEALMSSQSADILITEVLAYPGSNSRTAEAPVNASWRNDYRVQLTEAFGIAKEILNADKGGVFYVMYPSAVALETLNAINDAGLYRQQNLVWVMNNMMVSGKYDYRWMHENIAYGTSETDYEPIVHQDIAYGFTNKKLKTWSNDKHQPSVIQIDTKTTSKPLKLIGYFIKNHLKPGENVLDLKADNGVGLIACDQLHRRYFGVDADKDAVLTTLCRFAQNTKYQQPIIDDNTGEDIRESLKAIAS